MWIKLLKPVDSHQAGETLQVEDGVGKAYIGAGLAEDAGSGPEKALVAAAADELTKSFADFRESVQKEFASALKSIAETVKTPLQFASITAEQSEVDKKLPTGGFKSKGHFITAVRGAANRNEESLKAMSEYQEIVSKAPLGFSNISDSDGFMVPPDYATELWQNAMMGDALWPLCNPVTVSSHTYFYQRLKENNRTTLRNGGLLSYWGAEAGTLNATSSSFEKCTVPVSKLHVLTYVTEEQMEDAPALESWLNVAVPDEFNFRINDGIINGLGGDQLMGVVGHPATVSVAKETNQVAATIVRANIHKMVSRMIPNKKSQCVWLVNSDTMSQLEDLDILTFQNSAYLAGNLGASRSIWTYPDGSMRPLLNRRPVIEVEACATLGTVGDIVLAHLPSYLAIQRRGIKATTSMHVQFVTDQHALKWTLRVGGQPRDSSTITAFKGSATYGNFVTLATRT